MSDTAFMGENFIEQAEAILLENLSNAQFGVSELAEAMNMSRSSLLRKIKKHTQLSATQFIREFRLKKGLELLRQKSLTISEVSYEVGFGSTSYFIKCFREYYGHPPGELGKREVVETSSPEESVVAHSSKRPLWQIIAVASLMLIVVLLLVFNKEPSSEIELDKSIAVLPFKNESSDSTNLYFVNGLMESALTNLQKIEDLRVVSRTSVEQYRGTDKTIAAIAEELNVSYLVEGSGQRVGDQVLLNIQLIEASTDRHIWAEQYSSKVVDIFALQTEIAKQIADAIVATVTPAELEQIEKKPTENLIAYDFYLQALGPFLTRTTEGLEKAIPLFEEAIIHDPQFALAYADIAISYYLLDQYQAEQQYTELINIYADKALLYDSKLAESLVAKAFYYNHIKEYRLALPHLEKALEYNPNSSTVVQMLSDIYVNYLPNTAKYLEYALKGTQLDIAPSDSIATSYLSLHLSNAFLQNGFVEEAIEYIDKSLSYFPGNYYAPHVKVLMLYTKDRNIEQAQKLLIQEWSKDTTRLDILQEVAKAFYYQEDYDSAFFYYEKFVRGRESSGLEIFTQEDAKIGLVYEKMGLNEPATDFFNAYAQYCEKDKSIYRGANMAVKLVHEGKYDLAIEQLRAFSAQDNYQYGVLQFMQIDPLLKPLKSHPEFEKIRQKIEERFWENQAKLSKSLKEKGLM